MLNTGHRVRSVQGGGHRHRSTGFPVARAVKKNIRALRAPWTVKPGALPGLHKASVGDSTAPGCSQGTQGTGSEGALT